MRNIKYIVLHCTDTTPLASIEGIKRYWVEHNGWKNPGYHYIVKANGEIVQLLSEDKVSNGVLGFNDHCVNMAYIGGKTKEGKHGDTRTIEQEDAMFEKIVELLEKYPQAEVKGHGEFPNQGGRTCPNFNVKDWMKNYIPGILRHKEDPQEEE